MFQTFIIHFLLWAVLARQLVPYKRDFLFQSGAVSSIILSTICAVIKNMGIASGNSLR